MHSKLLATAALAAGANAWGIPTFVKAPPPTSDSVPVKALGSMKLGSAGFAAVVPQNGQNALFVSSFKAFGNDAVYRINDLNNIGNGINTLTPTQIGGSVTWPNDITPAAKSVFGTEGVVIGGGFLVPGKSNGGIYFSAANSDGTSGDLVELASYSGWFYHRVLFADVDGDGKLEMVSCRAKKAIFGGSGTMLVTLKPADASNPLGKWTETEVGPGCDALFTVADLDNDGVPEVIAASYFTSQLNLFKASTKQGFAGKFSTIQLDKNIGAAFDVQVVDINGDGKNDLLVTNHQGDGSGGVYAYEIPSDITNASGYTRHTLASNFPVTQGGMNQASPGSAVAFYPKTATTTGAPHIAVAGDAAQIAYVLVPGNAPWTYTTTMLHNCGCTVGKLAVADVNNDGYTDIIIPCYDNGVLAAYTFAQ